MLPLWLSSAAPIGSLNRVDQLEGPRLFHVCTAGIHGPNPARTRTRKIREVLVLESKLAPYILKHVISNLER